MRILLSAISETAFVATIILFFTYLGGVTSGWWWFTTLLIAVFCANLTDSE